jgi:hypothetical protein
MDKVTFTQPLTIQPGITFDQTFYWLQDGVAQSLSGIVAAHSQMRSPDHTGSVALWDISMVAGTITLVDGNTGLRLVIDKTVTAAIAAPGAYDVVVTWSDGSNQRFMRGPVVIEPGVTQ